MIYICADDYGLCDESNAHIMQCIERGALNKVSVFPNFGKANLAEIPKDVKLSLHLNLVEGRCMAEQNGIGLLVNEDGNFKNTFLGLFKLNLLCGKKLEEQAYKEICAQVRFWRSILPEGADFFIDSHQHTHMIPAVFRALLRVLKDEQIKTEYIRIPAEPMSPYIKTPKLWLTYSGINVIKQWLLKFLWMVNKKRAKEINLRKSYFFGILFSGKMDKKRVEKILPKYIKMAEEYDGDIEVLFHPGYLQKKMNNLQNTVFEKFYLSKNRKIEFDSVIELSQHK